jgi:chemotaxis protein methyltransferase CheR
VQSANRFAPAAYVQPVTEISDHEFALFQALICREAGIHLAPSKKTMLVSRLMRRVSGLKLTSFADYYRYVVQGDDHRQEMAHLLDAVCTNETWFFRNPKHFTFVREQVCPKLSDDGASGRQIRRLSAWSTACSSGEEPYSLAMVLLDALPGWELKILASDLSSRVLERAKAATWPVEKNGDIPVPYLKRYMLRGMGAQHGKMKAGPELQRAVTFRHLNLNDSLWAIEAEGLFDLIFCRNVLMYFEPAHRERALRRILARLAPNGYLFLGDAESISGFEGLRMVAPAVHRLAPGLSGAVVAGAHALGRVRGR